MAEFDALDIPVYGLSYDEADALADFRSAHDITFNLLSDPNSEVIRSFGILNTLIDENDHPWFGIPYPGTYIVSGDGTITHKFFDNNLAVRVGADQLLRAAKGETVEVMERPIDGSEDRVVADVRFHGESLTPSVLRELVATFYVPEGKHIYAEPAPQGTLATNIEFDDNPILVTRETIRPGSEPHKLIGTDEAFQVYHGVVTLRVPMTVNRVPKEALTISGQLVWQSCDDEVCDIPVRQRFEIQVPVSDSPPTAIGSKQGAELEPNAMQHFVKMTERRKP